MFFFHEVTDTTYLRFFFFPSSNDLHQGVLITFFFLSSSSRVLLMIHPVECLLAAFMGYPSLPHSDWCVSIRKVQAEGP